MPPPTPPGESAGDPVPGDLVEAGVYSTAAEGFDHGLVVLAMGCPYWLLPSGWGFRLLVEPQALEDAHWQLACFDRESLGWPPPHPARAPTRRFELATPLVWALLVLAVYCCQGLWPERLEEAGALDAQAVFDRGEWWRLGASLFLHADIGHLVSNELSGIFAFSAVLSTIGRRRGWLLLVLASVAGNLAISALYYPGPYQSIGASTAIFAALGLLTGRALRAVGQDGSAHGWRSVFAPLAAGTVLLGLFGAGGLHIDVGAHATGFAAGLVLGFGAGISGHAGAKNKGDRL